MSHRDVIGCEDLNDGLGGRLEVLRVVLDDHGNGQAEAVGVVVIRTAGWPKKGFLVNTVEAG